MRNGIITGAALAGMMLSMFAMPLLAQEASTEALAITAVNVTAERAQRGDDAPAYVPGDVIQYELRFTNLTDAVVQDVVLNDPIPQGLVMVLGSPTSDRGDAVVDYSIDGGASWSAAPMVEVLEAGRAVQRPAPASAYTHVRWTVAGPVPAGATVTARFHASVLGAGDTNGSR